ncbi:MULTISPECIES: helix-turn-helix transcriptional regulator [environmental samples]|uniref:helix-turn-helix domain-containing protein n=1 Tax=environmental samples TaxID=876090 RepID=UPI000340744B|nr:MULTISPECIES: helix-turn-helix transcriptional regulator [environmental samples]CDC71489.1 transcriptional regulator [Oscillibacter sp. CAG:155]
MSFGQKLQMLRQQAGMSQDALAERLGVSRQAVSRWERDETMPDPDKIVTLADLFGVTTDYLLRQDSGGQTVGAQPHKSAGRSGTRPRDSRDFIDRAGYLAKTKGYLLGWVLVAWGVLDLLVVLLMGMGVLGMLTMW